MDYVKTLKDQLPGFIGFKDGDEYFLQALWSGKLVKITGISSPDETATIEVTKDGQIVHVMENIQHDQLLKAVEWERAWLKRA